MADQFLVNSGDGEMWLPSDIFNTSSEAIPSQRFEPFTLRQRDHSPNLLSNLELFRPVGLSVSADCFSSRGNPYAGGGGGFWTWLDPVQSYRSLNPIQAQVWGEKERGMERWFLRSRVVENRIVRSVGNGRGYGGTGVYLPDYTALTTTIPTCPRKRNGMGAKHVNQACLKRCSPKKAQASKQEECHFQLPQEWTY